MIPLDFRLVRSGVYEALVPIHSYSNIAVVRVQATDEDGTECHVSVKSPDALDESGYLLYAQTRMYVDDACKWAAQQLGIIVSIPDKIVEFEAVMA